MGGWEDEWTDDRPQKQQNRSLIRLLLTFDLNHKHHHFSSFRSGAKNLQFAFVLSKKSSTDDDDDAVIN